MNQIVSLAEPDSLVAQYRVFEKGAAEKLADLYLPVRLRDFYLTLHPIVQCYLYEKSSVPEEFFVLVDQEYARFGHYKRHSVFKRDWSFAPKILTVSETKLTGDPLTLPPP